jgi:phospholipid/cholesterol/gamma-HCH transport system ATP-binding protein
MIRDPIIQVDRLTARYGDDTVLEDVSLRIERGEIFVIIGASGCGKSTLMRHMLGLDRPFSGQVKINGIDIHRCNDEQFRRTLRNIGVLFQNSALFGSMTLAENVALPITEYTPLPQTAVDQLIRMKLSMVELSGFETHLPSEISGGMKKRAGLARAMALNPEILFLDEPTSGLDPVISADIDQLIRHINQSLGTTMVIVSHDLGSILSIADRAVMLDKQRKGIIAEGDPRQLKDSTDHPEVRRFFRREAKSESLAR